MRSDGVLLDAPLAKVACVHCGLVRHARLPAAEAVVRTFGDGYGLYAHAPGGAFERERQDAYARWLVAACGDGVPRTVFEVGCGNGSLLQELRRQWPDAQLHGIDPSPAAVAHAREAGIDATVGYLAGPGSDAPTHELVVSVNVIEHTRDPLGFLQAAAGLLVPGGRLLLVCPDGDRPSSELLVHDHLYTFTRLALRRLAAAAGLEVLHQEAAPDALGAFQLLHARRAPSRPATDTATGDAALHAARVAFLAAWAGLDDALSRRCDWDAPLLCFGTGEATQLLAAYASTVIARVEAFVVDAPVDATFAGRPVLDYAMLDRAGRPQVLLGVRPQVQGRVAARLAADGCRPVRWDDLLPPSAIG
jgi:SAM-dependent methyltransferase